MDVIFQPSRGNPFYIEVGYFDTVLEIKEKIQKAKAIPISKQTLIFNGNTLHDDLNIHHSDILDRSRIHLLLPVNTTPEQTMQTQTDKPPSSSSKIQLLVKLPSSKLRVALQMDVNETIQRLKDKIQEMEGVPAARLVVHANGTELHDHKTMQECELFENSEINVAVRSSPPRQSPGNTSGSTKMRIFVLTKCGAEKIPVEVSLSDNVGELRKKLEMMKLELPSEGYFFIYKQNVMEDDRSFKWHHVCQGDTIEIFSGSVSGGS
ncbi:hypothetical protein CASFOL_023375 [Castilleja foliolosa]|uniref:Ubiquitin-like domain-containing protein n=1 Tax=Castilleja foliolosa TaxID=1961234 RepID=A0ABD3CM57_9LAMI